MLTFLMSISNAQSLKTMRAAAGWTQKDLAAKIGRSVRTVKHWESQPGQLDGVSVSKMEAAFRAEYITEGMAPLLAAERERRLQWLKKRLQKPIRHSTCDARNRKGTACRNKPIPGKRRCRFHGGLSTGPKTAEGKARIAAATRQRMQERKQLAAQSLK